MSLRLARAMVAHLEPELGKAWEVSEAIEVSVHAFLVVVLGLPLAYLRFD